MRNLVAYLTNNLCIFLWFLPSTALGFVFSSLSLQFTFPVLAPAFYLSRITLNVSVGTHWEYSVERTKKKEAITWGVILRKLFLKISQNSQENTYVRASLLIKLKSSDSNLIKKETSKNVFVWIFQFF